MSDFDIRTALSGDTAWLDEALEALRAEREPLEVLLPQTPRRMGRAPLSSGVLRSGDIVADLSAWRRCDAAGLALIQAGAPDDATLIDLHQRGDREERTMVLRALTFLPIGPATLALLGEVQRTNVGVHVEAAWLDGNLLARALEADGADTGFTHEDFARAILKMAFLDLPLSRAPGALDHASSALSAMLQDFATEREAAGRAVWTDTYRFLGRAPCPGAAARIVGGIESGSDPLRLAAAEALVDMERPDLASFAAERLSREPRPAVRALLEKAAEV